MVTKDSIDRILDQWSCERPELDCSGFAIAGRLLVLGKLLERRTDCALASLDLKTWAFDVLATLRRQGAPYQLTPTELSRATMLTSGAMTNRLDRLEAKGLIRRAQDPDDRRGVRIVLTETGLALADKAVELRFAIANDLAGKLPAADRCTLERLLGRLLQELEHEADGAPSDSRVPR
jgi:DNA-binding MarR family transcriptional regulator